MEEGLAKAKARERDRKGGLSPRAVRELSPIEVLRRRSNEPIELGAKISTNSRRDRPGEVGEFGKRVTGPEEGDCEWISLRVGRREMAFSSFDSFSSRKWMMNSSDPMGAPRHL